MSWTGSILVSNIDDFYRSRCARPKHAPSIYIICVSKSNSLLTSWMVTTASLGLSVSREILAELIRFPVKVSGPSAMLSVLIGT